MRENRWNAPGDARRKGPWTALRSLASNVSLLDFKLGVRMLARYPGLTVVGGLAMAFGIAFGASGFQLMRELLLLPNPYADEERIVRIRNVSTATTFPEERALHDYFAWREELRSVDHLSALELREQNLALGTEAGSPVTRAAVSATAFGLVPRPLLGRALVAADEEPGAPAVAVLAHDLWQRRFGGDPGVVGREVRLGGAPTTVVGVMPEDFAFFVPRDGFVTPVPQDVWVPFRLGPNDHARGAGPEITVFGRLAPGATEEGARAELAAVGARRAAEWRDTHERLKPELRTFGASPGSGGGMLVPGLFLGSAAFLALLMATLCANVALLFFARAAARESEMAVRNALGASRARIVFQLFAEALVLAGVAILAGLAGASLVMRWVIRVLDAQMQVAGRPLPSWIDGELSPTTVVYAVSLGLVGAVVAGVLPGLSVTRREARLQRLTGRGTGSRMSGFWDGVVIAQVALTVLVVPVAVLLGLFTWETREMDHLLPDAGHLSVSLTAVGAVGFGPGGSAKDDSLVTRFEAGYRELERRLEAEPGVTGVTVAKQLPGSVHPNPLLEVEGGPASGAKAQVASVDPDFLEVMGARVLAGRGFVPGDAAPGSRAVVVNESFVREHLGGGGAVGRQVRFHETPGSKEMGPWREIVGVVGDMVMTVDPALPHNAGIYRPLEPGKSFQAQMAVRVAGDPAALTGRVRELAAEAAPSVEIFRAVPLEKAARGLLLAYDAWFRVIVLAGLLAVLLTNAGIYAIISFTVSRRTREIGVRVALGADRRQVVSAILSRTARHVGTGVLAGAAFGILATFAASQGTWRPPLLLGGGMLVVYMAAMMGVCMLACVVPMRRALRIQPTEALGADT